MSSSPFEYGDNESTDPDVLVDEFLPVYDVSDAVATVVAADVPTTWSALMAVDLIDVGRRRPIVGVLGARARRAPQSRVL